MTEQKIFKITNKRQFNCIVKFMEKNNDIARGVCQSMDKKIFKKKWNQLCDNLNNLGPPRRDIKGWEKVWRDYKLKIKKKTVHNRKELERTGGTGPCKLFPISPLEESVAIILNLYNINNNLSELYKSKDEIVVSNTEIQDEFETMMVKIENLTDDERLPLENGQNDNPEVYRMKHTAIRTKKHKSNDEIKELLRLQTENMDKIVENTNQIASSLMNIEQTKSQKLILYERELENRMKYREEKNMWRKELIAYKKQKLAFQQQEIKPDLFV